MAGHRIPVKCARAACSHSPCSFEPRGDDYVSSLKTKSRIRAIIELGLCLAFAAACSGSGDSRRLTPGEVDLSFASQGLFALDVNLFPDAIRQDSSADFVTTDAAGNVWAAGWQVRSLLGAANATFTRKIPISVTTNNAVFMRLFADGTRDKALGTSGYLVDSAEGSYYSGGYEPKGMIVAPLADGGAVLAESANQWICQSGSACSPFDGRGVTNGRTIRIDASGVIDKRYGHAGATVASFERVMQAVDDLAGGVVFLGVPRVSALGIEPTRTELIRIDRQGVEDASFSLRAREGLDCPRPPALQSVSAGIARQRDGKLLVAQAYRTAASESGRICLCRLNPDGNLDVSYGVSGRAQIDEATVSGVSGVDGLFASGDGSSTLVMTRYYSSAPFVRYAVLSFTPQGVLDRTRFGGGATGPTDHLVLVLEAVAIQSDGKILAAGLPASPASGTRVLERIGVDGRRDPTFGPAGQGYQLLEFSGQRLYPKHIHVADGAIFVSGSASPLDGSLDTPERFAVAKIAGDVGQRP